MKKSLVLVLAALLFASSAFAAVGTQQNGTRKGTATDLNFKGGATVSGEGIVSVDYSAPTLTGGTANGLVIGGSTPAAGTFTTLASTGNTTLGDAAADTVTVTGTVAGATPLVFEGTTADAFETSLAITDPTADRTVTIPNVTGTVPLFQASFSATKLFVATDAVASGGTSKAVTVTGITTSAKCFASITEVATNSVSVRAVIPTADTATVHLSGDPGASNADICVICAE